MCNDKNFVFDQTKIADRINQLLPFDIATPEFGVDFEVYSAYQKRIDGWRQKVIDWALTKLPDSIMMTDGEVFFTRSSLRNALAHGKGKLKLLSIPYIPEMLRNGVLFYTEKKNDFVYFNYAYPFVFESEDHYAIIVVREDTNGKRFYDNEFITKVKTADGLDYSQGLPATRQKTCAHPSTGSILRNILDVKQMAK
ncbi:MAG: hypothetical protein LBI06_05080 [Treponema sp.]|jgi:hypothetical protein|nr:hypothetical protein [Treponema sp.]